MNLREQLESPCCPSCAAARRRAFTTAAAVVLVIGLTLAVTLGRA